MRQWQVAGAFITTPDGVLLVCNKRRDGRIDWTTPGGVIEDGEPILDGLAREVLEETGLTVTEWGDKMYEVVTTAPDLGWEMRVEVHHVAAHSGEIVLNDPDGIVIEAVHLNHEMCLAKVVDSPMWVSEPLTDLLTHGPAPSGARSYRYHMIGQKRSDWVITRLDG